MESFLSIKPVFKWKKWLFNNGIFTILVIFGFSYQSVLSYLIAFFFILMHLMLFLIVYTALRKRMPTGDKVIRLLARSNLHPPDWLEILYDGFLFTYLIAVNAYVFAGLYFVVMLIQRIIMHQAELYVTERPFR